MDRNYRHRTTMRDISRDRKYSFIRYDDESVLFSVDFAGAIVTLHLSKEDADKMRGDFNA